MSAGHPITLEPAQQRWRVYFNNHVIADTDDALILREAGLAPVVYFPREDVALEYMGRTSHHSRCPYKGEASYFTLTLGGEILENVAWSYEEPLGAVDRIAHRIAFYPDRVEVYAVDDARVNPRHAERERERAQARAEALARDETMARDEMTAREEIDEIIQHTDAGDGTSQREPWRPGAPDGGLR